MKIAGILLTIVFLTTGCGIKGDPLPPAEQQTIQVDGEAPALAPGAEEKTEDGAKKK